MRRGLRQRVCGPRRAREAGDLGGVAGRQDACSWSHGARRSMAQVYLLMRTSRAMAASSGASATCLSKPQPSLRQPTPAPAPLLAPSSGPPARRLWCSCLLITAAAQGFA